jgi:hypothetical protein
VRPARMSGGFGLSSGRRCDFVRPRNGDQERIAADEEFIEDSVVPVDNDRVLLLVRGIALGRGQTVEPDPAIRVRMLEVVSIAGGRATIASEEVAPLVSAAVTSLRSSITATGELASRLRQVRDVAAAACGTLIPRHRRVRVRESRVHRRV